MSYICFDRTNGAVSNLLSMRTKCFGEGGHLNRVPQFRRCAMRFDITDTLRRNIRIGQSGQHYFSLTRDAQGHIMMGTDAVTEITDLWTFERDLAAQDPTWRLIAARSA